MQRRATPGLEPTVIATVLAVVASLVAWLALSSDERFDGEGGAAVLAVPVVVAALPLSLSWSSAGIRGMQIVSVSLLGAWTAAALFAGGWFGALYVPSAVMMLIATLE